MSLQNYEDSEALGITTFITFMLTMMFHLFLYSYVGEQIMEKSTAISCSAYKATWYNLRAADSKPLIMLMARAKTPLQITAGKFFVLCLENYTDILKTSATYLSVLRAADPAHESKRELEH
ncbi:odorant receptor 4-like [Neodiprion lecontei]|uniref:Odorant receptor 4-like n=1 Tax=Neodiprion lecontei TaxID=441921 RepID=A0ABM3GQN4_NEOLC|nr:odorant receptor 4-like [Neodiprion lecontei]